jgi:hypothetical protein
MACKKVLAIAAAATSEDDTINTLFFLGAPTRSILRALEAELQARNAEAGACRRALLRTRREHQGAIAAALVG